MRGQSRFSVCVDDGKDTGEETPSGSIFDTHKQEYLRCAARSRVHNLFDRRPAGATFKTRKRTTLTMSRAGLLYHTK
jgi:hypothetical protein